MKTFYYYYYYIIIIIIMYTYTHIYIHTHIYMYTFLAVKDRCTMKDCILGVHSLSVVRQLLDLTFAYKILYGHVKIKLSDFGIAF